MLVMMKKSTGSDVIGGDTAGSFIFLRPTVDQFETAPYRTTNQKESELAACQCFETCSPVELNSVGLS